jgi:DNA-binding winged helix-turn-helix (wHTH) protein
MRVSFDRFVFDSERRELLEGEKRLHLGPKAFRALEILIAERPRAIAKSELHDAIWEGAVVDESNLAGLINELRDALGDQPRKARFIRTVHGFGYAFCGEIGADGPRPAVAFVTFGRKRFPLYDGANVLGRDPGADVTIDDETVSRRHAVITVSPNQAKIEDLSSKNGTFLDGAKLERSAPLSEGQRIVLGDAAISFRSSSAPGSTVSVSRSRKR